MPFPLAHPGAVLPLRRFCPRWLDFPALVIGSVVPDAGYLVNPAHLAIFSHRLVAGMFGFCLPVGLAVWLIIDRLRDPLLRRLAPTDRQAVRERVPLMPWAPASVVASLLLGTLTHWVLDSVTHWNGFIVLHCVALHRPLFRVGRQFLLAYDGLYYLFTFLGTLVVSGTYLSWLGRTTRWPALRAAKVRWGGAMLTGAVAAVVAWNCRTDQPLFSGLIVFAFIAGFAALTVYCWRDSTRSPR